MDQGKIWREFVALPPEAQRQVADFIAFLRTRDRKIRPTKTSKQIGLANEPFIGLWRDRAEMQDSINWVRHTREQEWVKNR